MKFRHYHCRATGSCWRVDAEGKVEFRSSGSDRFRPSLCKAYTLASDPLLTESAEEPAPARRATSSIPHSSLPTPHSEGGAK